MDLPQVKRLLLQNVNGLFFEKIYSQMNAIQTPQKKNAKAKALAIFLSRRFSMTDYGGHKWVVCVTLLRLTC